jgi:DNA-binding beta-propeller fold protein YncE
MTREVHECFPFSAAGLALALILSGGLAHAESSTPDPASLGRQDLPNMSQTITPLAAVGSRFVPMNPGLADFPAWLAGYAVHSVVSPDQKTLLVLTSGYNRVFYPYGPNAGATNKADSSEYVFIYDISTGAPVQKQALPIPNTYHGIVFDPSGWAFYVGGLSDDRIHIITRSVEGTWAEQPGNYLPLGHSMGVGLGLGVPPGVPMFNINTLIYAMPAAAGVAISSDGRTLVVANYFNDSITVFSGGYGNWSQVKELDLRPGKNDPSQAGVPGGEYPFWVAVKGNGSSATAYVSSIRDREIVVVDLAGTPRIATRIKVKGQPNKMTMNKAQTRLYVVEDQSDTVDVVDTATNAIVDSFQVIAPLLPAGLARYTGANPNSATLSADEKQLWVTNGNLNCVSVVALSETPNTSKVVGLVPTGWYPNSVSFGAPGSAPDGKSPMVYVVNGKSPTGPNSGFCYGGYGPPNSHNCMASNQYNPQATKAGLLSFPLPSAAQLATLTTQVATNNRFESTPSKSDSEIMAAVRRGVQHVILIIKENRTYDQILGDLEIGNGDPSLAEFGEALTPNTHKLARSFVTLDNFYATSEVSYDGWLWTTAARAPDVVQHQLPVAYAGRGTSLDSEGPNRSVNVAYATVAERQAANPLTPSDPDLLPGQTDVAAPDGPDNVVNTGYIWDSAMRGNSLADPPVPRLTVRNYGFMIDCTRYNLPDETGAYSIPLARYPSGRTVVAYPANAALAPYTDPYFRGFDNAYPDYYRFKEWEREFDLYFAHDRHAEALAVSIPSDAKDANGFLIPGPTLPALSLVRFMHDHTGNFGTAIDGVNTPELMQADNDYAVALLVQKIANSRYASNTLIFVIEDDAQDGGDHVDSHRTVALVVGAWVKPGALVSTQYNTIDFLRTIEDVLGIQQLNLNDKLARPMADIFTTSPYSWTFKASPAPILYGSQLPLPPKPAGLVVPQSTYDAAYWAKATEGMDFSSEDKFNFADYNRILWRGLMGNKPYPAAPTGLDLRANRKEFLARHQALSNQNAPPKKSSGTSEAAPQTKEQSE